MRNISESKDVTARETTDVKLDNGRKALMVSADYRNGAVAILLPGYLHSVSEWYAKQFYVLPVNEDFVYIADSKSTTLFDMQQYMKDMYGNSALSKNVYLYDSERDTLNLITDYWKL